MESINWYKTAYSDRQMICSSTFSPDTSSPAVSISCAGCFFARLRRRLSAVRLAIPYKYSFSPWPSINWILSLDCHSPTKVSDTVSSISSLLYPDNMERQIVFTADPYCLMTSSMPSETSSVRQFNSSRSSICFPPLSCSWKIFHLSIGQEALKSLILF